MLTRLLTAIVLVPLVLAAIFYLPADGFAVLMALCLGIGAWEWGGFMRISPIMRALYVILNAAGFALLWYLREDSFLRFMILEAAALWWLAALVWIMIYPKGLTADQSRTVVKGLIGLFTLQPTFVALCYLQSMGDNGPLRLMSVLVIIWSADTGAYFAGRAFGRNKLAPKVSPGKTWEGVMGGLACSSVLAMLGAWYVFDLSGINAAVFVLLGLLVASVSIVGDLSESMFKRHAGVKDSGQIFPGHGGMLDRIDSVTAAAPVFLLGLILLKI